jgi:pyruvate ferredoxin oxidoreductase alpha subunit
MHEMLFVASGLRLPIVMGVVNRALSAPLNIWNDEQDSFSERDSGWIQLYVENAQESFDTHIQAYKIAEELKTPVMVCLDGYVVSHTYEPIKLLEKQKVNQFLGEYSSDASLNPTKPVTMGPVGTPEFYMHFRKQQQDALEKAKEVIMKVNREFASMSKRVYGNGLIETIGLEGKENALVTIGSVTGTARAVLEKVGNIGIIRVRSLRPFPAEELQKTCANLKSIGVLEKDISIGANGSLYDEVRSALYGLKTKPAVSGFIAGLGGRDIKLEDVELVMKKIKSRKEGVEWVL